MKILLASASPRRHDLLVALGHHVTVAKPTVAELDGESGLLPEKIALINAQNKARQIYGDVGLKHCDFVLGADTVVALHKHIFGKAKDQEDAFFMLSQLAKAPHQVLTSYCLIGKGGQEIADTVFSTVEFRALSPSEITAYLKCGEWHDKAGAYAVQGFGAALVREVRGSVSNVIGLPIDEVMADARRLLETAG